MTAPAAFLLLPPAGAGAVGVGLALLLAATVRGREGLAFALAVAGTATAVIAVFAGDGVHGVLLASTLDPAWSLTLANCAADPYALRLISAVGVVAIPGVICYQAFSYVVFRRRVASERVPA